MDDICPSNISSRLNWLIIEDLFTVLESKKYMKRQIIILLIIIMCVYIYIYNVIKMEISLLVIFDQNTQYYSTWSLARFLSNFRNS